MYGELFIKPWELHRMSFREVLLAIRGLNEGKDYIHDLLYRSTMVITSSGFNAKNALSMMKKVWPLKNTGRDDLVEMAKKRLAQNQEQDDKRKVKKILNG